MSGERMLLFALARRERSVGAALPVPVDPEQRNLLAGLVKERQAGFRAAVARGRRDQRSAPLGLTERIVGRAQNVGLKVRLERFVAGLNAQQRAVRHKGDGVNGQPVRRDGLV
jgi:hypothetical protein